LGLDTLTFDVKSINQTERAALEANIGNHGGTSRGIACLCEPYHAVSLMPKAGEGIFCIQQCGHDG
jgi:hypothetical protein